MVSLSMTMKIKWILRLQCSPNAGSFGHYSFPYMAKSRLAEKLNCDGPYR